MAWHLDEAIAEEADKEEEADSVEKPTAERVRDPDAPKGEKQEKKVKPKAAGTNPLLAMMGGAGAAPKAKAKAGAKK